MIEIAIVVSCCVGLAGMLKKKGRSPAGYIVLFVALWFGGEFGAFYLAGRFGVFEPVLRVMAGFVGAAIGAGTGWLIVVMLPNISRQTDYSNRRYGYAPNLPNSNAPWDPANPYAAPQRSNPPNQPPVMLDPNDVMGWLDQQQNRSQ